MGIRIFLRTDGNDSRFRVSLNRLIRATHGDSLVICSGYISDIDSMKQEISDSIKLGCKTGGTVTLIAGKLENINGVDWEDRYKRFAKHLKLELALTGINLVVKTAPGRNWHAKIAFKLDGQAPVIGLMGSSNLTGPAYLAPVDKWNYESDVLMWDSTVVGNTPIPSTADPQQIELDMVVAQGTDRSEKTEMVKIYSAVLNQQLNDITDSI